MSKTNKSKELQSRPTVPGAHEITEDLEKCESKDVVFTLNSSNDCSVPSFEPYSLDEDSSSVSQMSSSNMDEDPDVELVYQKAIQFSQLTEQLKTAPETLRNKTEYLERLGEDLVQSIGKLKVQAQKVANAKMKDAAH